MTRNRTNTRERLLGSAEQLLIQQGFRALGVNAIAAWAGIDKVMIYRYFGGLDGLLESLAAEREIWPDFQAPGLLSPPVREPDDAEKPVSPSGGTLAAEEAARLLWDSLCANVRALRDHPLALEIFVWSCAESNPLTRSQAKIRRRQTRELGKHLDGLSLGGLDAPAAYALLWKGFAFALVENHRKAIYKKKDWKQMDQAGEALFQLSSARATHPAGKKNKHKKKDSQGKRGKKAKDRK